MPEQAGFAEGPIGPVLMHHGRLQAMAFSQRSRTLMTLEDAAVLQFWNVKTAQLLFKEQLPLDAADITQARFSPDGRFLVIPQNKITFTTLRLY